MGISENEICIFSINYIKSFACEIYHHMSGKAKMVGVLNLYPTLY